MKKFTFFLLIFLISSTETYSKVSLPKDIYFHVYRNGSKIGYHKIDFYLNTDENKSYLIKANIEISFDVKFLGFSIYNYKHSNDETWKVAPHETMVRVCEKCNNLNILQELNSVTNKNGSEIFCNIKVNFDGNVNSLKAKGSHNNNPEISHINTLPSSYWDYRLVSGDYNKKNLIKEKTVFNSQDCSKINFKIKSLGKDKIYNGLLNVNKYKLEGKESTGENIDIDIWYDDLGNWVKMIFIKDGSEIEYFLDTYHEKK